jgi:hypothetical protein
MRGFDTKMLFVRGSRLSANSTANGTRQEIPARLACLTHRANRAGQSTPTGGVNSPLDNSAPRAVLFKRRARLAMLDQTDNGNRRAIAKFAMNSLC